MTTFLHETNGPDEHQDPQVGPGGGTGGPGDDFDAGGGEGDEFGFLAGGDARKGPSHGTILVAVVVAVAVGAIFGMRWLVGHSATVVADTTIETRVEAYLADRGDLDGSSSSTLSANAVIASLTDDRTDAQVPLRDVREDPFRLERRETTPERIVPDPSLREEQQAEQARRQRLEELRRKAGGYRLTSVMGSEGRYTAVIADQVLQVGDVLDDVFTVTAITPAEVTLMAEGETFKLPFLRP